jgi:predicted nuclease of predicted toxin-antitoxin system
MDAPDTEIMAYAATHDYIVVTHDLDFSAVLAATQGTKPSVVQIRSDNLSPAAIGEPLIAALRQMASELASCRSATHGRPGSHSTPCATAASKEAVNMPARCL